MPLARPERRKLLVVGGLLFVHLLLISLQVPLGEAPSYLERVVFIVLSPVEGLLNGAYGLLSGAWNRYLYLKDVEAQNRDLREETFQLRQENLIMGRGLERLQDREAASRVLSGLHGSFITASAIGVDALNVRKSIVIDRGTADGLRLDMPVVDAQGRLVGRTIKPLSIRQATVELLTNQNSGVGVVSVKARVVGVLSGDERTGQCRMKYVEASNEALEVEEELVTSGYDKIFPAGIPVGRIASIKTEAALFKAIAVRPYLEIRNLKTLAVLTSATGETR
ncbi:MAG: rod shape-determining protein MreC [Candidatus Aminicenantes bacterium]|nr:rod shape-determining protein MreC [Candidatus Aminicenantes bacterium]